MSNKLEAMANETESLPRLATVPVMAAALALLIVLSACASHYGFDRDELYFRMLPPAWGYLDQPPLVPALVRLLTHWVADEPWAARIPAVIFAVSSVPVIALIAREVGGGRLAQGLAAWGFAFGSMTLSFGHVFLTASADLLVWPAISLFVIRAVRRNDDRWWIWTGIVVGLSSYNKLLVAFLLVSLASGLLITGPRRVLRSGGLWIGAALAMLIAAPNVLYQALHGWPQLEMGAALSAKNASSVRVMMWPMLLLMLGPLLVPIWVAGLIGLLKRPSWHNLRFLLIAFPVLLSLVWFSGGQFYYPYGLLAVIYSIGCVPTALFVARRKIWTRLAIAGVAINSLASAVISLPIIPSVALGATPIPAMNSLAGDQLGWPTYAREIDEVAATVPNRAETAILTSNYGEAGALAGFGQSGLPVFSGHNELYDFGPPPESVDRVVVVGGMLRRIVPFFGNCTVVARLENEIGVPNEEEGQPIAICQAPKAPWSSIWPALKHLD